MKNLNKNWKEKLASLLSNGANPIASKIWILLTDAQRDEFIDYQFDCLTDFSECGNWDNGKAPSRIEVKSATLYIIDEGSFEINIHSK